MCLAPCARGLPRAVGETVDKVRVCHRCLYGREYNRKNEESYLSWIKAENLFHTDGYLNFRSQPDKQKVIGSSLADFLCPRLRQRLLRPYTSSRPPPHATSPATLPQGLPGDERS